MERFFVKPIKPDTLVAFTSIIITVLCHKHLTLAKSESKVETCVDSF